MTQRNVKNVPLTPQRVVPASYLHQVFEVFFLSTAFHGGQVFSAGEDQQFGADTFDVGVFTLPYLCLEFGMTGPAWCVCARVWDPD